MKIHRLLVFILISLFFSNSLIAQKPKSTEERKKELIKEHLLFNSAQGRDFWFAIPPNEADGQPLGNTEDISIDIYVTSSKNTDVTLEVPGLGHMVTKKVQAMKITTFSTEAQETSFMWEIRSGEEKENLGIHLYAKQPLSVYVLNHRHYTSEGYLAIPTSAWGTEYIHLSYYDFWENLTTGEERGGGFIIVASEDNTNCRIELRGLGKGLSQTFQGNHDIGDVWSVKLDQGQCYLVRGEGLTRGQYDLSGSTVASNKPIGFISFHMRTLIPSYDLYNGRDLLVEMMPPVTAWGKKYTTVEYMRENRGDFFRIVASEPNTKFSCKYYDLETQELLGQWGYTLKNAGDFGEYLEAFVELNQPNKLRSIRGASVWEADKPVLVMQYSYSHQWDDAEEFDPFMILVVPVEQFIPSTVFQTPAAKSAFLTNWFNIVAVGDTSDLKAEKIKSITLDDKPVWSLESSFPFNNIPTTNLYWAKIQVEPGAHVVKGDTKFGGYIYGFSQADSYGWPAAMAINKLDETDTLEPELYITGECGDYEIRATEFRNGEMNDDPRQVDQGVADVSLLDESFNYDLILPPDFKPYPPVYDMSFELKVINKFESAFALFAVVDRAGNVAIDSVRYEPDSLILDPDHVVFGDVRLKTSKEITANLENISDSSILITEISLVKGEVFEIISGEAPPEFDLPATEKHEIVIRYTPVEERMKEDDLDIDSIFVKTECMEYKWPIDGRGVIPRIVVEDWDAGAIALGTTVCKNNQTGRGLKIENTGSMELIINGFDEVMPPFSMIDTLPELDIKIAPQEIIYLEDMCYTADDKIPDTLYITFHSNADPENSDSVSMWTGRGLLPGPHITSYDWMERRVLTQNAAKCYITNSGNTPIRITDVKLRNAIPDFSIDKAGISPGLPVILQPDTAIGQIIEIEVPVNFEPMDEGPEQIEIIAMTDDEAFINDDGEAATGLLEGIGTRPWIRVTGYVFDPPVEVDKTHPDKGIVTIESYSQTQDLYIESIKWSANAGLNQADFKWLSHVPADTILPMGEKIELEVEFTPSSVGVRTTLVEVMSDAATGPEVNPIVMDTAYVTGIGFQTGLIADSIDFGDVLLCDTPEMSFHIENTSVGQNVTIDSLEVIEGEESAFTIVHSFPDIIPGETVRDVKVLFNPEHTGPVRLLLKVHNNIGEEVYVLIKASGYDIPIEFALPTVPNMAPGLRTVDPLGRFPVNVKCNNWKEADIMSFDIEIYYKPEEIKLMDPAEGSNISKGEVLNSNWTISCKEELEPMSGMNKLTITGSGTTPITKDGVIAYPVFDLLLGDTIVFDTEFGDFNFNERNKCIVPTGTPGKILLNTCVRDLRSILVLNADNYMHQIEPNPVGDNGFTLRYSVATDMPVLINIYNSSSLLVKNLIDGPVIEGSHEIQVDTRDLPSGVYFVQMKSGSFIQNRRLVISK